MQIFNAFYLNRMSERNIIRENRGKKFLFICVLILSVLSFVRFIDNVDYWIVDILSHFPVQYAMMSFILLIFCIWKRTIPLSFLAAILFIINITVLLNFNWYAHASLPNSNGDTFRVYSANINKHNKDLTQLIREMEKVDAEIVLLSEVTPQHMKQLNSMVQGYKHNIMDPEVEISGIGVLFLSKFPVLSHNVISLSDHGNAIIEVELIINKNPVLFYGVHLIRPGFLKKFQIRQKEFLRLASDISDTSIPVITAGDFNAAPYSPVFKKFLKMSGLRNSSDGFGWLPSWPTFAPLLWIPIDHILVTPEIQVIERIRGSHIGSDHYPIIAELSI